MDIVEDGMHYIMIDPRLCHDHESMVEQALLLCKLLEEEQFRSIGKCNVVISVNPLYSSMAIPMLIVPLDPLDERRH